MLGNLVRKIVGSSNDRAVKRLGRDVDQINAFESTVAALDDAALAAKTVEFRERLDSGATLDSLLPEAFAVVREAGKRALGMRHFDVQMIGGMVLDSGKIAEMRTGEGKTLVATTAVYLNALPGEGVHVITVNDYLARRDAEWMAKLYEFLGLTVGIIVNGLSSEQRREAYACDVTYGTNNEFGFDYLRDNMAHSAEQKVQRGLNFAIVDEVDSILIDEARTPLIISGPADGDSELYNKLNVVVPRLVRQQEEEGEGDFSVDEKSKQVHLTEEGMERVEELLIEDGIMEEGDSLYDPSRIAVLHHLNAALRAHAIYQKDKEYIVAGDQIVIVDEFTGRTMPGRRWSEGLHQAIEAKEAVTIQRENQTLASITFQNFFRLYDKLAGMTGTADTEAYEFQQIYGLEVVVIPTHRPMVRDDKADLVFLTQTEKYDAIIEDIEDCAERGQPVLVGTTSVETSEYLSGLLKKKDIAHEVLNAKQHEREANIVENAGRPGAVTIATNMAGRGTDIVLGGSLEAELAAMMTAQKAAEASGSAGDAASSEAAAGSVRTDWDKRHDEVLAAGGLHIIGTERHESRRIDNQLRGRSGRQGDPGSTRFYLSLEDSLMRIFASERVGNLMQKLGMQEGEAIEHPWVTKAIENAQRKVEGHNFDMRKNLLEYDDVANDQRKVVYEQRNELMESDSVGDTVAELREEVVPDLVARYVPPGLDGGGLGPRGARAGAPAHHQHRDRRARLADRGAGPARGGHPGAHPRAPGGGLRGQGGRRRRGGSAPLREVRDAAGARRAVEGAPRRHGLPPPEHRAARLRPEEPQAGIQEGGVRAVHRHARRIQERRLRRAEQGAGQKPRAGGRGRAARRTPAADARQLRAPRGGERAVGRRRGGDRRAGRPRPRAGRCRRGRSSGQRGGRGRHGAAGGRGRPCRCGARRLRPHAALPARGPEDRAQRSVPLRLGEEVQELPRQAELSAA